MGSITKGSWLHSQMALEIPQVFMVKCGLSSLIYKPEGTSVGPLKVK